MLYEVITGIIYRFTGRLDKNGAEKPPGAGEERERP